MDTNEHNKRIASLAPDLLRELKIMTAMLRERLLKAENCDWAEFQRRYPGHSVCCAAAVIAKTEGR